MKTFVNLTLIVLAGCGVASSAAAADAPMVRETFVCQFNAGQDMGDLMAARDFYLKQVEKLGQDPREHFVWTPFKGDVGFDFLWAVNYPDLVTFGRESDVYRNSAEGKAADERFAQVATCTSGLSMRRQFIATEGDLSGDRANGEVVGGMACSYRRGHGPDDLEDLLNHISGVIGTFGRKDGFAGYVVQPITSGPNTADLYFMGVQGTLQDWAERHVALQSAEGGPALGRHFNTILDCNPSVFLTRQVVPKPA